MRCGTSRRGLKRAAAKSKNDDTNSFLDDMSAINDEHDASEVHAPYANSRFRKTFRNQKYI